MLDIAFKVANDLVIFWNYLYLKILIDSHWLLFEGINSHSRPIAVIEGADLAAPKQSLNL